MILEPAWTVLWWENARRHRRIFDSETLAHAFASERELVVDPDTITVREFIDHIYLPLRRRGDGSDKKSGKPLRLVTLAVYSTHLRAHVFPAIGDCRLRDLTTEQLRQVLVSARERLERAQRANDSMHHELDQLWGLIRSIAGLASRVGYCHVSAPDHLDHGPSAGKLAGKQEDGGT